jgi:hypothetical protein
MTAQLRFVQSMLPEISMQEVSVQEVGMQPEPARRDWNALRDAEQTELRVAFGHYLDGLPPTCSLDTKIERFRAWLAARGVDYRDAG